MKFIWNYALELYNRIGAKNFSSSLVRWSEMELQLLIHWPPKFNILHIVSKRYWHMKFCCNLITPSWCVDLYVLGYIKMMCLTYLLHNIKIIGRCFTFEKVYFPISCKVPFPFSITIIFILVFH